MEKNVSLKTHYGAIDGLRAYSALGIVLMHVLANGFNNQLNGFIYDKFIGSFANLVFFVYVDISIWNVLWIL